MTTDNCHACAEQVKKECARADAFEALCKDLRFELMCMWTVAAILALGALVAAMVGCSQPPPSKTRINAVLSPPKPPTLPKHAKHAKVAPGPLAVAPLPYFMLTWEDLNTNRVTFNVYGTSDYKVWTLLTNVPREVAYLKMVAPCQVYWITALDRNNHESRKPTGWIK